MSKHGDNSQPTVSKDDGNLKNKLTFRRTNRKRSGRFLDYMSINYVSQDLRFHDGFRSWEQCWLPSCQRLLGGLTHHQSAAAQVGAQVGRAEVGHGRIGLLGLLCQGGRALQLVRLCWRLGDDRGDSGGRYGAGHLVQRLDWHGRHGDQH